MRIKMGGFRGDVISLGFIQTTTMEMGELPAVQGEDPGIWVDARQYTGRIVTVANDKIFENPVYNFSRCRSDSSEDAMSRDILKGFEEAKLSIASGTYGIVQFPEIDVRVRS